MSPPPRYERLLHDGLLRAAERSPDAVAVVADGRRHTYAELRDEALRVAVELQCSGLGHGDRVAIFMPNGWPAAVSVYGALLAGGVPMVLNAQTKADKLAFILDDSGASALLADGSLAAPVREAVRDAGALRCVIVTGRDDAGLRAVAHPSRTRVRAWSEALRHDPAERREPGTIPTDLAALIYTSGSTGRPKGVMMTHQAMVFTVGSLVEYLRLTDDDRILNVMPLAFDYGLYQLLMAVHLGASVVLERSFTYPDAVLRTAEAEGVTVFPGVPTIFAALLERHRRAPVALPSVTRVTNTAAHLPDGFVPRLREIFPNGLIFKMYGLTECKRVAYLEPELIDRKPGSVGKAIPGTQAQVLREDGSPAAPGEAGILHVRGPHLMAGYWGRPEATAAMLRPGRHPGERILCTHDWFSVDREGFLYFLGRSDDIIKTRGEKVSPTEVENVLHEVPGIREAAVIGVADELLGEAVRAYVVTEDGAQLTEQDVKRACLAKLEGFMVPKEIVFLPALPKTENSKVRKKSLPGAA